MVRHQLAVIYNQKDNGYCIQSPGVGWVSRLAFPGRIITRGDTIGRLQCISTTFDLIVEANLNGKIAPWNTEEKVKAVGYGQPLFEVQPLEMAELSPTIAPAKIDAASSSDKLVVAAPSDGIFYRRPGPDASCYVEIGDMVKEGQVLGLVEVMKCFNQITYNNQNPAKVIEICVADAGEVKYRQPLFILGY